MNNFQKGTDLSDISVFVDESGPHKDNLFALACIITQNHDRLEQKIKEKKNDIFHDPRYKGILGNFVKEGFHYCDNHLEIRNVFLDLLRMLEYQAYICFSNEIPCGNESDKRIAYNILFKRLLFDRLKNHREDNIEIFFEQHDSKTVKREEELYDLINLMWSKISAVSFRTNIKNVPVRSAGKDKVCLSIPDYILGVFCDYFSIRSSDEKKIPQDTKKTDPWQLRNFEDLRPKIRLIHDFDKAIFYDRKNPFL